MFRSVRHARTLSTMLIAAVLGLASLTASAAGKQGVVIQISDADAKLWNLSLNVAKNVQEALGKDKVDVEIVAFGPGLGMLKFDSPVVNRMQKADKDGVMFRACGNTMKKAKVTEKDLAPGVKVVPAGVIEIMEKQGKGWHYIKL